jgi:hypothetical protein
MASDAFNGTTVTWPSTTTTIGSLQSVNVSEDAAMAEVTSSTDTINKYEPGSVEKVIEMSITGGTTTATGEKGALAVAFNDGSSASMNAVLRSKRTGGSRNGAIESSLTFAVPSTTS